MASSAMRSRSARVRTPPVGLAGELMTSTRVRGVISDASSSTSSRKSLLHPDRDRHRRRPDEPGQRLVDRVAGVRDEHLVTGIHQAEDRVQHHALAADGHEDLRRIRGDALARGDVGGDRLAQRRDAGERRVVRLARRRARAWPPRGRCAGVSKSGSPIWRWMIDRPSASSARARATDLEGALGPDGAHPGRERRAWLTDIGGLLARHGSSERIANVTLAGRSASRRMYHGYQASPYAMSVWTR